MVLQLLMYILRLINRRADKEERILNNIAKQLGNNSSIKWSEFLE